MNTAEIELSDKLHNLSRKHNDASLAKNRDAPKKTMNQFSRKKLSKSKTCVTESDFKLIYEDLYQRLWRYRDTSLVCNEKIWKNLLDGDYTIETLQIVVAEVRAKYNLILLCWEIQTDGSFGGEPYYREIVAKGRELETIEKLIQWNTAREDAGLLPLVSRFEALD